jgi:ubiquinone/menaquinone biosynthesis C-methylase UbiE
MNDKRAPDREAALAQYRRRASVYDLELALFEPVRRRAVAALDLHRGQTVLDVACGTGLSLPLLVAAVGAAGHVVGIEQSPEMIEQARARVAERGWKNVLLVNAPVEAAALDTHADAALFHFTHDVLLQPQALRNVFDHLHPGARVVATGLKWAPAWAFPVNLLVLPAALHSVTSLAGLDAPWRSLQRHVRGLKVQSLLAGAVYLATGRALPTQGRRHA